MMRSDERESNERKLDEFAERVNTARQGARTNNGPGQRGHPGPNDPNANAPNPNDPNPNDPNDPNALSRTSP